MSHLDRPAVKRVRDALLAAGLEDTVMELAASARTAEDAAAALGCPQGAIVKSLVFCVGTRFVMALVAGDHQCLEANLPKALNLPGAVRRPQASEVKGITGFTIGGVAPLGMTHPLPMVLDTSLRRFETIYAAGGHPNCIFPIAFTDLARISAAIISYNIASPSEGVQAYKPPLRRSKTLSASQN
jgi:prolyl-tRNA editing enzyme YbaK/EbsC (Cys-tRNA(Pro) deacylase)